MVFTTVLGFGIGQPLEGFEVVVVREGVGSFFCCIAIALEIFSIQLIFGFVVVVVVVEETVETVEPNFTDGN